MTLPERIYSGEQGAHHCQGIAVDVAKGYIYFSFTTTFVKADLSGRVIGSVSGFPGHLGCMAFDKRSGRVYASLELKRDMIGKSLIFDDSIHDAFYIAIFDVDKINAPDMDAAKTGVVKTVALDDVLNDYNAEFEYGGKKFTHKYGCSGIDGLAIGRDFGADKDSEKFFNVCYGVYSDIEREDNDYQVILQYAFDELERCAQVVDGGWSQSVASPKARNRYFVYTGNTTYGIQNLEYDEYTGNYFMAVYRGKKEQFTNFNMFVIDGSVTPKKSALEGCYGETGLVLTLAKVGEEGKNGIFGSFFPFGATGIFSLGDGRFYFSEDGAADSKHFTNVVMYRYIGGESLFERT